MMRRKMIIDGFDTWEHGHFTMTEFSAPAPRYRAGFQEVPGMDGYIDRTELPLGRPCFSPRTIIATFECSYGTRQERQVVFDRLIAQVNGRRVKLSDPDHPQSYFEGRVYITQSFNRPSYGELKLEAVCDPWRYSLTPSVQLCKIHTEDDNKLNSATVTLIEDLSTANNPTCGQGAVGSFGLLAGNAGRVAVWQIALTANTSYYVTASIRDGRGTWGCAASADASDWVKGMVRTGADGMLYVRLLAYSTDWVVFYPFVILEAHDISIISNGPIPVQAKIDFSVPFPTAKNPTVMYGTGSTLAHIYNATLTLPPGESPLVLYCWSSNPQQATVPISWTRGDF